jgi:hypothetical protein
MAIDEGPPTLTSRVGATFTVANMATAVRAWLWDQNYGGVADEDLAVYFDALTGIHDQTPMKSASPTLDASHLALNLHILNPIGYKDQKLPDVLVDLIVQQAHAGHGKVRMHPTADAGVNAWTPNIGTAPHYTYVDEFVDDEGVEISSYLTTATVGAEERYSFPTLPGNATSVIEAIVSFLGQVTKGPSGSDYGMAFEFKLGNLTFGDQSRIMFADMYANGTLTFAAVKLNDMLIVPSTEWASTFLSMKSARGTAGPSPNPNWYVRALEMAAYYAVNPADIMLVNATSFTSLSAASPYTLDFDIIEAKDYYEAALDILGHGPEYFLYLDYRGQLSMGKVKNYTTATPIDISDMITGVAKSPYKYRERSAHAIELRWGVQIPHSSGSTAAEDPVNVVAERGSRRLRRSSVAAAEAGWGDAKVVDRHFIRSATVAESCAAAQLEMWGDEPDAVDLYCTWRALEVEPGDVVTINRPELGFVNRKFSCVANPIDPDSDRVILTIYDVDFTL